MIAITGDTYPVRDQLSRMGCEYDRRAKLWYAPKHIAGAVQKLVAGQRYTCLKKRRLQSWKRAE